MRFFFFLLITFCFLSSCHVDKRKEAYKWYEKGKMLEAQGHLNSAVNAYRNAADFSAGTNDRELQSEIYNCLGDIFLEYGVYDRAMEAHRQAVGSSSYLSDKSKLSMAYRGIGKNYYLRGKRKEALHYFLMTQKLEEQISNREEIASIYNNLSNAYCELGIYDKALLCNTKAIQLTKDSLKIYRNSAVRGRIYMLSHRYDSASHYIFIASKSSDMRVRASSYYKLSDMPVSSGITDSMKYAFLSMAEHLSDSIEDVNRSVQIVESEHSYQLESFKDKEQNKLIYIVGLTVLAVLILIIFFYNKYKRKTIRYEKIIDNLNINHRELHEKRERSNSEREKMLISIINNAGDICVKSFITLPYFEKLKVRLQQNKVLNYNEQSELQQMINEKFDSYIRQISVAINNLSENDTFLCCLSLLKLSTKECALCRGVSSETIRSQRTRIKKKIPQNLLENGLLKELFGQE